MPQVLCTLPNAGSVINGVAFTSKGKLGMISEEITDEQAAYFLKIKGYAAVKATAAPAPAPSPAPTPSPAPSPTPAEDATAAAAAAQAASTAEAAAAARAASKNPA